MFLKDFFLIFILVSISEIIIELFLFFGVALQLLSECILNRMKPSNFEDFLPRNAILLYDSSENGMSNYEFHKRCDNQGPTITFFVLNGTIVVGVLYKSWNQENYGWHTDPNMMLFLIKPNGSIVNLEQFVELDENKFYNGFSSGPKFSGLPIDLRFEKTEVHLMQRELITGGFRDYLATINRVMVYKLNSGNFNFMQTKSMKEHFIYRIINSKLQVLNETPLQLNAVSLLLSSIQRIHSMRALQKLKTVSIFQSRFLRIKATLVLKELIEFDKGVEATKCVGCDECFGPFPIMNMQILPCCHVLCGNCVVKVFNKCPYCRKNFQHAHCKDANQIVSHLCGSTPTSTSNRVFLS
jgi:hypothetical protein